MAGGARLKIPSPVERLDLSEGETLGDVRAVSHSKGACHRRHFRLRGARRRGAFIFLVLSVVGGHFGGDFVCTWWQMSGILLLT